MKGLWIFLSALACVAATPSYVRDARFRRDSSSSSSSSYSGSSSGAGGVGGGGTSGYSGPASSGVGYSGGFPASGAGGIGGGFNNGGFAFPNPAMFFDFNSLFQQYMASLAAAQAYAATNPQYNTLFQQQLASLAMQQQEAKARLPYAFPDSNAISPDLYGPSVGQSVGSSGGPAFASASANLGPNGGYGQASVVPGGPDGLGLRTVDEFPAPSGGGSFGTFSSSSSGTSDVNGKRTSYKTASFGTNDNGKITFRTVSE